MQRSFTRLKNAGPSPLYYLGYRLYEGRWHTITASEGAVLGDSEGYHWRVLSVDLRVGSPQFDNTHFLRIANTASPHVYEKSTKYESFLPDSDAGLPLKQCLWLKTDTAFKEAQRRIVDLRTSNDILAREEDVSSDFSLQPARSYFAEVDNFNIDSHMWQDRVRHVSSAFKKYPYIEHALAMFHAEPMVRYFVNSEGSKLVEQLGNFGLFLYASAVTSDGMTVWLSDSIESKSPDLLPDESNLTIRADKLAQSLKQLVEAPMAEPYVGPAILSGKAAAVFFHETFGHRVEGIHEKNENEGKTFARKLGTQVMPKFISIVDDPTVAHFADQYLNGHYKYDDQGVAAQPVHLVEKGVLTGLLLDRTLVQGFKASNGHGRASPGWNPTARQSNLFIYADGAVSPQMLRKQLIAEAVKQHKPYGLYFDEISGGSTLTLAESGQTYLIHPLRVYKVYVDNRPDELIRGAEITGTPLNALERIIAAGTDRGVFNGRCGRDSGPVPVSASSPSLLLSSIEIKRASKQYNKAPVLPDPSIQFKQRGSAK